VLLACVALAAAGPAAAGELDRFLGHWEGTLVLPSAELDIAADLAAEGGALTGTLDIPAQGAKGLPLTAFDVDGAKIRFKIQGVPGDPTFDGTLADGAITGPFIQGGQSFSFELHRVQAAAEATAANISAVDAQPFLGHWEGQLALPTGEVAIKVDLAYEAGAMTGTVDIPMQGANGLKLNGFAVDGNAIQFAIDGVPGSPIFDGALADGKITGKFKQGGAAFDFELGRGEVAGPNRPQEPKPPFPYDEEEVSYTNGEITLAGTVTMPKGEGPFPAAVLITGSGAQDRNEALLGHKPFLVLADHLTRAGIVVLRVDDRGVGGSTGSVPDSTTADFATDVLAGVRFLMKHDRIDPKMVGVIGHSEGGIVGPLAASQSKDVAFVVMLAGTGVPGSEILPLQMEKIARAEGVPEEKIAKQLAIERQVVDLLASDRSSEEIEPEMRKLVAQQIDLSGETDDDEESMPREEAIEQAIKRPLGTWFRYFVRYDPRPALRKVTVPVLVLNGSLDTQVDPEQNLPEIEKALLAGGNPDVTIEELPGLNHLFQTAGTGAFSEYAKIEETMSPMMLEVVSDWILERFG